MGSDVSGGLTPAQKTAIENATAHIPAAAPHSGHMSNINIFGGGSDGDVTISSDTTLSRNMSYDNLTIDAGFTLYPNGYIINVKNTLTINGTISRIGNNAPAPTSGGAALPDNRLGGSGVGGPGGGNSNPGGVGGGGDYGGPGGAGATRTTAGGAMGALSGYVPSSLFLFSLMVTEASNSKGGGGGGGGGGQSAGNYGGGGGGGAGVISIFARIIIIGATGEILLTGGVGSAAQGSFGGGGGGGGGGALFLVYYTYTNNGTIDLSGGMAGQGAYPGTDGGDGAQYNYQV